MLGRISLFFDYGWSPDPVGEFLDSLDVSTGSTPGSRLSGHGRPFIDVHGHIEGNRQLVAERLAAVSRRWAAGPRTAVELAPRGATASR